MDKRINKTLIVVVITTQLETNGFIRGMNKDKDEGDRYVLRLTPFCVRARSASF